MSYLNIDMNEENYDYQGLLNLFSLEDNFDHDDLKIAKRKVMNGNPIGVNCHENYLFL